MTNETWAKLREYLSHKLVPFDRIGALLSELSPDSRMEARAYIHAHEPTWPGAWPEGTVAGEARSVVGLPDAQVVWCPVGRFMMGSPDSDKEAYDDEKPQHEVTLSTGFWMWQTPLTQAQYEAVSCYNPSSFKGEVARPVETVSWYEAVAYCNALSEKMGLQAAYLFKGTHGNPRSEGFRIEPVEWAKGANGWRLPTEAEWEYACRAETRTPRYGEIDQIAWYLGNLGSQTHAVGQKQPNAWGLHDTLGNVFEWCWDWYIANYYAASPSSDQGGPVFGFQRVLRGGSWFNYARFARAAARGGWSPGVRDHNVGFRIVKGA